MKKTIPVLLLVLFFLVGCRQGGGPTPATIDSNTEAQTMSERILLTPDQLISMANLPQEQYEAAYLQRFISYYHITESNVGKLNIERLLADYEAYGEVRDVSSIFTEPPSDTFPGNPEEITAIAFYKNYNTSIDSVYYDFTELACYRAKYDDVFSNLNRFSPISLTAAEADELRKTIVDLGVLEWKDTKSSQMIVDPQTICIAIRFADGSLFRASASGILSECAPSNYEAVCTLLFAE